MFRAPLTWRSYPRASDRVRLADTAAGTLADVCSGNPDLAWMAAVMMRSDQAGVKRTGSREHDLSRRMEDHHPFPALGCTKKAPAACGGQSNREVRHYPDARDF
jgi:hypothetical protein